MQLLKGCVFAALQYPAHIHAPNESRLYGRAEAVVLDDTVDCTTLSLGLYTAANLNVSKFEKYESPVY